MMLLKTYLLPYRNRVLLLALILLTSTGFQLALPQLLSHFIDVATAAEPIQLLLQIAIVFWIATFIGYLLNLARTYLKENIAWNATNRLRSDLAAHCLRLDLRFHHAHGPGELIERIDGDVSTLASLLSDLIFVAATDLLLRVGVLIVTLLENWQIGLAFIGFATFAMILLYSMRNIATKEFELDRQTRADLFSFLEERLAGTNDIRANGGAAYTLNRLFETMRRYAHANMGAYRKIIRLRTVMILLFSFGTILSLALGVVFYRNGAITLGMVFAIYTYMRMLAQPIERLTLQIQNFQTGSASIKRIEALRNTPISLIDGDRHLPDRPQPIHFENVDFGYADNALILQNLSFSIPPGETLGLVGRTGSGKTSIARLLMRFYDPQSGIIRVGDTDLRDVPLAELRTQVALVTQDVHVFSASVRDNLTFFDHSIADNELLSVIESLGLRPWFDRLPSGLDTLLEGGQLSAGEAQLIALARVFIKNPRIIILDEASSRLDPETEVFVDHAISRLLQNRTGILIAHRLTTLQRVNRIMVLREGEIVRYGKREELENNNESIFSQMLRSSTQQVLV
jgi:ATP-binding cassette, subfamily B, bacterial